MQPTPPQFQVLNVIEATNAVVQALPNIPFPYPENSAPIWQPQPDSPTLLQSQALMFQILTVTQRVIAGLYGNSSQNTFLLLQLQNAILLARTLVQNLGQGAAPEMMKVQEVNLRVAYLWFKAAQNGVNIP